MELTGKQLRSKRVRNEILATMVATRAGLDGARLCRIERGYIPSSEAELRRIDQAIDELILARKEVQVIAERVGWPLTI